MISWYSFCHFVSFSSLRRLFPWTGLRFPLPRSPKTRNKRGSRQQVSHVSFLFPSVRECPKATVAEAAGESPKPASSSSWAYRADYISSLYCNWVAVQLGSGQCNISGNDLHHFPQEVLHTYCPFSWLGGNDF